MPLYDGPKPKQRSFAVEQHPHSEKHLIFKVYEKGRVYACVSAWQPDECFDVENPKPTTSTVQYAWRHSRHEFLPYDESTGRFKGKS